MNYIIRTMRQQEYPLLKEFLYQAIYIPEGITPPPKSVINQPELQEYIHNFGSREDDLSLVAEVDGQIVGAIWARIMNDYGHIDNETPSLAMSVLPQYRKLGIGTALLQSLLSSLKAGNYKKVSLSVQKANYAVKMYLKAGFLIINENKEEYLMVNYLY